MACIVFCNTINLFVSNLKSQVNGASYYINYNAFDNFLSSVQNGRTLLGLCHVHNENCQISRTYLMVCNND